MLVVMVEIVARSEVSAGARANVLELGGVRRVEIAVKKAERHWQGCGSIGRAVKFVDSSGGGGGVVH